MSKKTEIDKISSEVMKAGLNNGLNLKDIKFTDKILKGKTQNQAYKEAIAKTDNRNVIDGKASIKIRKDKIQKTIIEVMEDKGLDDENLIKKHAELLNKKEVLIRNNIKTGKIETIPTGEIDATAVKNALDMAYKLKKHYEETKGSSVVNNLIQININRLNKEEVDGKLMDLIKG